MPTKKSIPVPADPVTTVRYKARDVRAVHHKGAQWFVLPDVLRILDRCVPSPVVRDRIQKALGPGHTINAGIPHVRKTYETVRQVVCVSAAAVEYLAAQSKSANSRRVIKWLHDTALPTLEGNPPVQDVPSPDPVQEKPEPVGFDLDSKGRICPHSAYSRLRSAGAVCDSEGRISLNDLHKHAVKFGLIWANQRLPGTFQRSNIMETAAKMLEHRTDTQAISRDDNGTVYAACIIAAIYVKWMLGYKFRAAGDDTYTELVEQPPGETKYTPMNPSLHANVPLQDLCTTINFKY